MAIPFTPDDVASGFNLTKLNANFDKVGVALSDALSRTGQGANQMGADIDLNNNDLLNVRQVDTDALFLNGVEVVPVGTTQIPNTLKTSNALSELALAGLDDEARTNLSLVPGRAIGNILKYEDVASIPTIKLDSKIIFKKDIPTNADGWDVRVFRDNTGVVGGTPGFVNSAFTVDTTTGTTQTSFEWNALFILQNHAAAGENTAAYFQATKNGQGQTWGSVFETREVPTATYGGLVGIENAISANGLDPSNVRIINDVIGARYDDTLTIHEIYAGVRITAAWNGSGSGVESAKIKRPLLIEANWTEAAIFAVKREDIATGVTSSVHLSDLFVPDGGNLNELMTHFTKTASGAGAANTGLFMDRLTDGTLVGRFAFNGDRSVDLSTGTGGTTVKLIHSGGLVIPAYAVDPSDTTNHQLYFNTATEQLRVRVAGGWLSFVHV